MRNRNRINDGNHPYYFRCFTCGALVSDKLIARGLCAGHKVGPAFRVSLWEWLLCKLGII